MNIDRRRVSIGIDIGTTNIGAAALDPETGEVCEAVSFPGNAAIPSAYPWEKTQDPQKLYAAVKDLLDGWLERYPCAVSVGFTGQMHGVVILDEEGSALSPLYTWQDERAGRGDPSSCRIIEEKTGYRTAPGYGLATAYDLLRRGMMPQGASSLGTVMDTIVLRLTGRKTPLMHATNAASLGLFDLRQGGFDENAAEKLGLARLLPEVSGKTKLAGTYRGVPVAVSIGDNQAAFLGAVKDPGTSALANIGTGSQISLVTEGFLTPEQEASGLELRPYVDGRFLVSGSALCGGRAYALLERFFRLYAKEAFGIDAPQYDALNRLAANGLANGLANGMADGLADGLANGLANGMADGLADGLADGKVMKVTPSFTGTRTDPKARGRIDGIGEENFTPASLAAGMVLGMAEELHAMYARLSSGRIRTLIASGSAVRRNPALLSALKTVFGMETALSGREEEAAVGAAEFAWKAVSEAEA